MNDKNPPSQRPFSLSDVGGAAGPRRPSQRPAGGLPNTTPKPGPGGSVQQRLVKANDQVKAQQYGQAMETLKPLLKKKRPDAGALHLMAIICEKKRQAGGALDFAKKANRAKPNDMSKMIIARAYRTLGKTEECLLWVDKVLKTRPDDQQAVSLKAGAHEDSGRVDEAEAILLPLMESANENGIKLLPQVRDVWARILVQRKKYAESIALMDEVLEDIPNKENRVGLFHLKAKAHDRSKEYDKSWEAAERANEVGELDYDPDLHTQQVDMLIDIWAKEHTDDFPITACESVVPVFVAGMPRSGTSLIDQIIDAHPLASGVGELSAIETFAMSLSKSYDPDAEPDKRFGELGREKWQRTADEYVKHILNMSPDGSQRVVNKALGNNKLVGLIARLFPKTRIIHAIRDPRDVAISCFMGGFNNQMHPWTARVEWAAHTWGLSQRMMDHWKETLDVPILDVHYEHLVADPENEFPRLIEFLELDFDASCYDFYKSKRTVRTLSYDQVNRPLYTTSSGRHKNYARHIESIDFPNYDL